MLSPSRSMLMAAVAALALLTGAEERCSALQQPDVFEASKITRPPVPLALNPESTPLYPHLKAAFLLGQADKIDQAIVGYRGVLEKAIASGDQPAQAQAHDGLGSMLYRKADYDTAQAEASQALGLYQVLRDSVSEANVTRLLGNISYGLGDMASARDYYHRALLGYETLGMLSQKAHTLLNLHMVRDPEGDKFLQQALEIGLQLGDKNIEARALHNWGDKLRREGDLDAAQDKFTQAAALYEAIGDDSDLARVLTSQGIIQRMHGHPETALPLYQRALELQHKVGDRAGQIQSINATAATLACMHDDEKAVELYQQALAMARETGSAKLIRRESGNLARAYLDLKRDKEGVSILEDLVRQQNDNFASDFLAAYDYQGLARGYFDLGKFQESVDAASKAIEEARISHDFDPVPYALLWKARSENKLGNSPRALADAQECIRIIEGERTHLVPSDFMKRGFADQLKEAFDLYVGLLAQVGDAGHALEVAEEARARAFLDLLATRNSQLEAGSQVQLASLRKSQEQLPTGGIDKANAQTGSPAGILMRGGNSAGNSSDSELRSLISVPPFSLPEVQATARRLNSTVLSYWVAPDATYLWVVSSRGAVHTAVVEVTQKHLEELVSSLGPGAGAMTDPPNRSGTARPAAEKQFRDRSRQVGTRGGTILTLGTNNRKKWRELYNLLIEPVEAWLPPMSGSLLTIEPQGPLLMLPFAALIDKQGRYLLERFNLHYTPAVSLLQFTQKTQQTVKGLPPHYLLVADPSQMPLGPEETALPALPGSRQEVATVARMLHGSEVTLLEGKQATEAQLGSAAGQSTVLHIATHGIIRDDRPFESFLALAADRVDDKHDGRLTAQKIYGLDLHADLVFLSACRSGVGKVSGDGLVGLTRAFWYAGTPSVIASLWDVADEPTYRLVSDFYRSRLQGANKSRALRSAQLHLLQELRAGRVVVHTASNQFTLPDDPMFWAGFVLQGEP